MILTINGKQAALKKGSSIEYVSENRIFTDADDYSMENLRENDCLAIIFATFAVIKVNV